MKKIALSLLSCFLISFSAFAEDVEGSKDYPIFSRMPNFEITEYSNNFDAAEFHITEENLLRKEGTRTFIRYNINSETAKQPR